MTWRVDRQARRTFDPDQGCELLVEGSHADGVDEFRIIGPERDIIFLAEIDDLSNAEKLSLNLDDAIVWKVTAAVPLSDREKETIVDALTSYQLAHGLNPKSNAVFVRFGRGVLFGA